MTLIANHPASIGKVLDTSFKLYAACFKQVIGYGLIVSVLYLISASITNIIMYDQSNADLIVTEDPASLIAVIGLSFLTSFLTFVFYAAMVYRFDNFVNDREDTFGSVLVQSFKKLPAMILCLILYLLAVMGGSLLLLIPGMILWFSLSFYIYFLVIEDASSLNSLKASHKLVWGDWWRTFVVFTVPMLTLYFEDIILFASMGPADIFSNLMVGVIMPFFYAVGYCQYRDLKLRKSGADLEARMTQVLD